MKNIERGTIKHLVILIIAVAICGMIIYPIFDLFLCKFIIKSEFVYSFKSYIIQPITASIIAGSLLWVVEKKSNKK